MQFVSRGWGVFTGVLAAAAAARFVYHKQQRNAAVLTGEQSMGDAIRANASEAADLVPAVKHSRRAHRIATSDTPYEQVMEEYPAAHTVARQLDASTQATVKEAVDTSVRAAQERGNSFANSLGQSVQARMHEARRDGCTEPDDRLSPH